MQELVIGITRNPVYQGPSPLSYEASPLTPGGLSAGFIGGLNFNPDLPAIKLSLAELGVPNIDAYNPVVQNEVLSVEPYVDLSIQSGSDLDLQIANHNLVNGNLAGVMPREDVLTCKAIARIGVIELQALVTRVCVANPEVRSKAIFCGIATALNNKVVNNLTEATLFGGCKVSIKIVRSGTKDLVDIVFEWANDLGSNLKNEIAFWLNFVNSTEGMFWLTNKFSHM